MTNMEKLLIETRLSHKTKQKTKTKTKQNKKQNNTKEMAKVVANQEELKDIVAKNKLVGLMAD